MRLTSFSLHHTFLTAMAPRQPPNSPYPHRVFLPGFVLYTTLFRTSQSPTKQAERKDKALPIWSRLTLATFPHITRRHGHQPAGHSQAARSRQHSGDHSWEHRLYRLLPALHPHPRAAGSGCRGPGALDSPAPAALTTAGLHHGQPGWWCAYPDPHGKQHRKQHRRVCVQPDPVRVQSRQQQQRIHRCVLLAQRSLGRELGRLWGV